MKFTKIFTFRFNIITLNNRSSLHTVIFYDIKQKYINATNPGYNTYIETSYVYTL